MSNYFDASGTIGFTCDNCGRELQGCTWVNGMRFCAKCYQETFGASKDWQLLDKDKTIAEQRKQIADLEAKLAEKEQTITNLIEDSSASKKLYKKQLEEQLANAIVLPKELQVGNKIFWANENGCYSGKIYAITKDINYKEDSFNIWIYCVYNNGLTYYHLIKDYGVELFATEEEALAKLEELTAKNV